MRKNQDINVRATLEQAVENGYISAPHLLEMPSDLPFEAALCTVKLPAGCLPPENPLGVRIGAGVGADEHIATFLAMAEAAERYSLQFTASRPETLHPVRTVGGPSETISIAALTLGSPSAQRMRSKGSALGETLDEAVQRACLEQLEHFHIRPDGQLIGGFKVCKLSRFKPLHDVQMFLQGQLRELDVRLLSSELGYFVAHVTCRDCDGGRRTFGSAASISRDAAAMRAVQEAVILWRNMIEMEKSAVKLEHLEGEHAKQVAIYRGAEPFDLKPIGGLSPNRRLVKQRPHIVEVLSDLTGSRVRVFNLSVGEIGLPVAKILVG